MVSNQLTLLACLELPELPTCFYLHFGSSTIVLDLMNYPEDLSLEEVYLETFDELLKNELRNLFPWLSCLHCFRPRFFTSLV